MLGAGLLAVWCAAAAAAGEPVAVSTAAARRPAPLPLSITIIKDRQSWRLEAGCTWRWDFDDLKEVGPGLLQTLCSPLSLFRDRSLDLFDNTRVLLYGVRISPAKVFYEKRDPLPSVARSSAAAVGAWARPAPPRRRFHPSLLPVIDDITKNLEEDLKRAALKESLRQLPPEARRGTFDQEKAVLKDLLRARDEGLPLGKPGEGLDYLLREKDPPRPRDEGVRLSTAAAPVKP